MGVRLEPEDNQRLLCDPPAGTRLALIEADGGKVGFVVWQQPTLRELDGAGLNNIAVDQTRSP